MILRLLTKMTLTDDEGNIIKEEEYGNAYLDDIDMAQAAEDWWHIRYSNRGDPIKRKKETPKHCFRIRRIVDILIDQLQKQILNEFLCDRDAVYKEYKE